MALRNSFPPNVGKTLSIPPVVGIMLTAVPGSFGLLYITPCVTMAAYVVLPDVLEHNDKQCIKRLYDTIQHVAVYYVMPRFPTVTGSGQ